MPSVEQFDGPLRSLFHQHVGDLLGEDVEVGAVGIREENDGRIPIDQAIDERQPVESRPVGGSLRRQFFTNGPATGCAG